MSVVEQSFFMEYIAVCLISEILKKIVNSCIYLPEFKKKCIYLPELILELLKIPGLVYRILN